MASQNISKTISANSNWQLDNLGVIIFVQNTQSKEIFQSEYIAYNDLSITDIREISSIPEKFNLSQNYPNPFNPSTLISFQLSENNFTELKVYDILGNETATLISKKLSSGAYEVDFNATEFSSGIYFYVLKSGQKIKTKKMILLK
jgi:Secretion system C-terminal sorting domain